MKISDLDPSRVVNRDRNGNSHISIGGKPNGSKPRKVTMYHPLDKWSEAIRAALVRCLINEYGCDPNSIKVDKKAKPKYVTVTGMTKWSLGQMLGMKSQGPSIPAELGKSK